MAGVINIIVVSAPLEEGWEGTPDEFREQIFSTLTFQASGAFLTGQIGGATPTTDVGLFIDGQNLYTWDADSSTYKPINTVAVGMALPYFGGTAPAGGNYLLCDGGDYLRADYPALFALIGTAYNIPADPSDRFRVPDLRGRTPRGAGIGDYDPLGTAAITGKMDELTLHEYGGREWPVRKVDRHLNQPGANTTPGDGMIYSGGVSGTKYTNSIDPYVAVNWYIRAK